MLDDIIIPTCWDSEKNGDFWSQEMGRFTILPLTI